MLKTLAILTRPPALLTAPSDTLTGLACLSAMGIHWSYGDGIRALMISLCIYAGGMVMNDVFDATLDAQERPERPIPSGRISLRYAIYFGCTLHMIALLSAWSGGNTLLFVCMTVLGMTYLYNALLKESIFGPLAMSLCRVGNLWIGVAITAEFFTTETAPSTRLLPLILSLSTGLYVYTLTRLSRFEVLGGTQAQWWGWSLCILSGLPIILFFCFDMLGIGVIVCLYLIYLLYPFALRLSHAQDQDTQAQQARSLVGSGVRGVALLNASYCLGLGAWESAFGLLFLSLSARHVARYFATT